MHLLVTDRLACPRCGPGFGLILFADRLEERRVFEGALGCANCRERYPVEGGFCDLRPAPRGLNSAVDLNLADDPEGALRIAALLGVREGPGLLLLMGESVRHAPRVAAIAKGIEVVAAHPALRSASEVDGVSRVQVGERLPFFDGSVRGVVLGGGDGEERLREAIRILAPEARLVVIHPGQEVGRWLETQGVELLMEAPSAVVGFRK